MRRGGHGCSKSRLFVRVENVEAHGVVALDFNQDFFLFVGELFGDKSILRLISDTHLPSAVKVNCKNHSLPEIFREFYSVLSSTAVKTVYVTDRRNDSTVNRINSVINAEIG